MIPNPAVIALTRNTEEESFKHDTVVVGGWDNESLVMVKVRDDGKATRRSGARPNLQVEHVSETTAIVQIAARPDDSLVFVPAVLAGVPLDNVIYVALLPDEGHLVAQNEIQMTIDEARNFGGAVGAGNLGVLATGDDREEWIVTSDDDVFVFFGEPKTKAQSFHCSVPMDCPEEPCTNFRGTNRSIVTGRFYRDLDTDTVAAAVGTPGQSKGQVHFVRFTQDATDTPSCSTGLIKETLDAPDESPEEDSQMFGIRLLTGPLDSDGLDDLLVGAPDRNRVYVYLSSSADASGWSNSTPAGVITPMQIDDAVDFGASMTWVDLDGDGRRELAVGDPGAYVDGIRGAGKVHFFSLTVSDGAVDDAELGTVQEMEPQDTGALGLGLSKVVMGNTPWAPDVPEELVVVANNHVFIFFMTGIADDRDPR